jgi:hypothetical protein
MTVWTLRRATARVLVAGLVSGFPAISQAQPAGRSFGVQVAPDAPRDTLGALITAVTPGSLAERLGLRAGDKLLRLGRVDLVRHRTDPKNAASSAGRLRVAIADPVPVVPVLVWRGGTLLTGVGAWDGAVPVPLQSAEVVIGALSTLATQGVVPVESQGSITLPAAGADGMVPAFGAVSVPATGGAGSTPAFGDVTVPSTGGAGRVPAFGEVTVPRSGGAGGVPTAGGANRPARGADGSGAAGSSGSTGGLGNREWRAACAALTGPRPAGKYFWLSSSGSSSEMLWLNTDGSYSTQRSSAYSSYTEDGCFVIDGAKFTFYKVASAAMASAPTSTGQRGVTLGSASGATFEPRTVSFAAEKGALVIGGDRYTPTTDR